MERIDKQTPVLSRRIGVALLAWQRAWLNAKGRLTAGAERLGGASAIRGYSGLEKRLRKRFDVR
jgi:hypothetical protein